LSEAQSIGSIQQSRTDRKIGFGSGDVLLDNDSGVVLRSGFNFRNGCGNLFAEAGNGVNHSLAVPVATGSNGADKRKDKARNKGQNNSVVADDDDEVFHWYYNLPIISALIFCVYYPLFFTASGWRRGLPLGRPKPIGHKESKWPRQDIDDVNKVSVVKPDDEPRKKNDYANDEGVDHESTDYAHNQERDDPFRFHIIFSPNKVLSDDAH
jgi:hypothetical protein